VSTQLTRVRRRLGRKEGTRRLEAIDWSEARARAEGLLRFLDAWNGPLPTAMVQALTVPEVRERLVEAVRHNDEARAGGFVESWDFVTELFVPAPEVSTGLTLRPAPLGALPSRPAPPARV